MLKPSWSSLSGWATVRLASFATSSEFRLTSTVAVVNIVNRTLATLDLNPLLINLLNEVTDVVTEVVAAVDSLLGSIVQGNSKINFIIDNLGNIVSLSRKKISVVTQNAFPRFIPPLEYSLLQPFVGCDL